MSRGKVLIITIDGDQSSDNVIDWLTHFGFDHARYNVNTDIFNDALSSCLQLTNTNKSVSFSLNGKKIDMDGFKSIWFRKYSFPAFHKKIEISESDPNLSQNLHTHLKKEFSAWSYSLFEFMLLNKKVIGRRITRQPSKIEMLTKAREAGLDIPNTIITNKKSELVTFYRANTSIITKSIRDGKIFHKKMTDATFASGMIYTEALDENLLSKIPDYFFPSLFQEKIDKDIEIRAFYLDGDLYSSAIFSQLDDQTNVDFRMYNDKRPNRIIPYILPACIKQKIENLMRSLQLVSGSLDLIKTKEGRFVFLEVNPWGQYGMISQPCNFSLDRKIAQYLIN